MSLPSALSLATAFLLTACASGGGLPSLSRSETSPEGGGIQTRAIGSAPATREAQNQSRPLSELNTAEAIAAREHAARSADAPAQASAPVVARAPAGAAKARAARPAAATPTVPPAKPGLPAKGGKVLLRDGASLHARPNASSEKGAALATSEVELGSPMYNADGYWWYVQAGKESGWLSQADIQR